MHFLIFADGGCDDAFDDVDGGCDDAFDDVDGIII